MLKALLATTAVAFIATPALAAPVVPIPVMGGPIVVSRTGNVTATFVGKDARYTDLLTFNGKTLFNNKTNKIGDMVDLGTFAGGTVLNFALRVIDTHSKYYTGPASSNPDGVVHTAVTYTPSGTLLGFEDLPKGGDKDYNDLLAFVSNTGATAAPEPATWAMMIIGFGFVGGFMRRKSQTLAFA